MTFRAPVVNETVFHLRAGNRTLTLREVPELHLFVRDPQEFYDTIVALPVDQWGREIHSPKVGTDFSGTPPYYLPVDVVLPFRNPPTVSAIDPLLPGEFWRINANTPTPPSTWFGIASDPTGFGSIKAARRVTLPRCSSSVPLQPLFDDLSGSIRGMLPCSQGGALGVDTASDLLDLTAVQYFGHRTGVEGGPRSPTAGLRSGVLVGGRVHIQITSKIINSYCDIDFAYDYDYALADGFATLVPHRIYLTGDGPTANPLPNACYGTVGQEGAVSMLAHALEVELPNLIHAQAVERQQFPSVEQSKGSPFNTPFWSCRYSTRRDQTDAGECLDARHALSAAASTGAFNLGLDLTTSESDQLLATINDTRNWRCRPPSESELAQMCSDGQPIRGRCQFQVRAEAVLPEPDELRVVPFINPLDYTRPGVVLLLSSFLATSESGIDLHAYEALCTPPRDPQGEGQKNVYGRTFAGSVVPQSFCQLPPPPLPPPSGPPPPPHVKRAAGVRRRRLCSRRPVRGGGVRDGKALQERMQFELGLPVRSLLPRHSPVWRRALQPHHAAVPVV